jgi:hypothetical protein
MDNIRLPPLFPIEKVIYFLPEAGTREPISAYDSSTLDLYFNIKNTVNNKPLDSIALNVDTLYEFELGLTSYSHLQAPDCLVLPRSSASKVEASGPKYLIAGECEKLNTIDMTNDDQINVKSFHNSISFRLANTMGLIDRDYRGNWIARGVFDYYSLHTGRKSFLLDNTKPWLQVWCPDPEYKLKVVKTFQEVPENYRYTLRGAGGFGSSNK